MHVRTVAVGKDRPTHLTRMYGLRESVHGGQSGHQGAPATKCVCVCGVCLSDGTMGGPIPFQSLPGLHRGRGNKSLIELSWHTHTCIRILGLKHLPSLLSVKHTVGESPAEEYGNGDDGWPTVSGCHPLILQLASIHIVLSDPSTYWRHNCAKKRL